VGSAEMRASHASSVATAVAHLAYALKTRELVGTRDGGYFSRRHCEGETGMSDVYVTTRYKADQ
jgi:hypothetical protein